MLQLCHFIRSKEIADFKLIVLLKPVRRRVTFSVNDVSGCRIGPRSIKKKKKKDKNTFREKFGCSAEIVSTHGHFLNKIVADALNEKKEGKKKKKPRPDIFTIYKSQIRRKERNHLTFSSVPFFLHGDWKRKWKKDRNVTFCRDEFKDMLRL